MRVAFDLEQAKLLSWAQAELSGRKVRRRDTVPLELKAVKGGVFQELPTDTAMYAVLKNPESPGATALASAGSFTRSGAGSSAVYTMSLNLNTAPLNAAFASEPASVAAVLEIKLLSAFFRLSSEPLVVTVQNDYGREAEMLPDVPSASAHLRRVGATGYMEYSFDGGTVWWRYEPTLVDGKPEFGWIGPLSE